MCYSFPVGLSLNSNMTSMRARDSAGKTSQLHLAQCYYMISNQYIFIEDVGVEGKQMNKWMERGNAHNLGPNSNSKAKDFSNYGSFQISPGSTAPTICDAHSFLPPFIQELPMSRTVLSMHR